MMLILWCGVLLLTHFLCHVKPCNIHEYETGYSPKCCKKCEPGQRMTKRCNSESPTICKPCSSDFYMDEYSTELDCKRCSQCTKEHMVYKVTCSKSTDAVCDCESGYKCNGNPCTNCEKIPTTPQTTTTLPPTTPPTTTPPPTTTSTVRSTVVREILSSQDTVWITLSLCCVCILLTCFILISRPPPPCGWIMLASAGSFWGSKKNSAESSQCTEDEEVPMPVQEVCGHKEWQEEI